MKIIYDDSSETSILEYAMNLRDKTLRDVLGKEIEHGTYSTSNKGELGENVECYYFGIKNNNSQLPDFQKTGIELKVTPMIKNRGGHFQAKERLVLGIINYLEEYQKTWLTSTFIKKSSNLLLLFYHYEKDKSYFDYYFRLIGIHRFSRNDLAIIKNDWEKIVLFIKNGKAHELSEKDTHYLAASRKGAGNDKDDREQPFSKIPAKQRAFSLKQTYMNTIIIAWTVSREAELEPLIVGDDLNKNNLEEIVISRISRYYNKNTKELEKITGYHSDNNAKNKYSIIGLRLLGINKGRAEEFEKAGITIKTIRLMSNGTPKESMSFPFFHYLELINEEWETSTLYSLLDKRFLFLIFQYTEKGELIFKKAQFWSIPFADIDGEVRLTSEKTKKLVAASAINKLPGIKDTKVVHVRPHGRNAQDVDLAPNGSYYPKKSFWLNAGYLKNIIS